MYLDEGVRSAISGLALLDPAVVARMVDGLRADLDSGAWHRRHRDLLDLATFDHGYRLVIAAR